MLVILIDHLGLYPSIFQYITGRGQMWVSAAEGFFFISGAMVGLLRGKQYLNDDSIIPVAKKLLKRSWQLYLYYAFFTIISVIIALLLIKLNLGPLKKSDVMTGDGISRTFWNILQLSSGYGYINFLKYYTVFMLLSIPILWLMKKQMWYLVLGISVLCWFEPRLAQFSFDNLFFFWFTYFSLGLIFGYYYENIKAKYLKRSMVKQKIIGWLFVSLTVLILVYNWFLNFYPRKNNQGIISFVKTFSHYNWRLTDFTEFWLYNNRTGIMRLVIFLMIAPGIFYLFRRGEPFIKKRFDWILGEFGRNSLRTFIVGGISVLLFRFWAVDITFLYNSIISVFYLYVVLKLINLNLIKKYISN